MRVVVTRGCALARFPGRCHRIQLKFTTTTPILWYTGNEQNPLKEFCNQLYQFHDLTLFPLFRYCQQLSRNRAMTFF